MIGFLDGQDVIRSEVVREIPSEVLERQSRRKLRSTVRCKQSRNRLSWSPQVGADDPARGQLRDRILAVGQAFEANYPPGERGREGWAIAKNGTKILLTWKFLLILLRGCRAVLTSLLRREAKKKKPLVMA